MTDQYPVIDPASKQGSMIRRAAYFAGITLWSYRHHRPFEPDWSSSDHAGVSDDQGLPSIALVTPALDSGPFLEGAIKSVLDQEYPLLRYVVCDGGSTDETPGILERYREKLSGWVSRADNGQSDAINRGIDLIDEDGDPPEIMGWLNADDRHLPWTLREVGRYFRDHPEIDAVYGNRIIADTSGRVIGRWLLPKHSASAMLWRDYVPQETLFWRRSLWEKAGGQIDPALNFAMDWDLLVRFHHAGARMARLPMNLGVFTAHDLQKSVRTRSTVGVAEFAEVRAKAVQGSNGKLSRFRLRIGSIQYIFKAAVIEWACRFGFLSS